MDNNLNEVRKLLMGLSDVDKSKIPLKDDSIDKSKLYEVPEFKIVIDRLNELKITTNWLSKNGFIPATILFAGLLDN